MKSLDANSSSTILNLPNSSVESLKRYGTITSDETLHNNDKPSKSAVLRGIRDMLLASFSFSMMHLSMKLVIKDGYSVSIALAFRSVSTVLICMWYAWYYSIPGGSLGPRSDWYWLNFRGILGSVATILFYISMTHLDLGDSVAMTFIAPVVMPILANLWLKESYSAFDALATLFAMSGVVFISKPAILFGVDDAGESSSPEGIIIGLASALIASVGNISIRKVSPNAHTIHIVNYMMLWTIPVCFGMIVYGYNTINFNLTPKALFCFFIVSICSFFGQFLMSRSLLTTPTRFVTPIIFSQVIFAYINQFLFWGVHPTQTSTMGVVLVAVSLILLSFKI